MRDFLLKYAKRDTALQDREGEDAYFDGYLDGYKDGYTMCARAILELYFGEDVELFRYDVGD